MLAILAGNLCSLLGTAADSFSASRKTVKGVLLTQALAQLIYGIGMLFLKGYSAGVQNAVSIFRNLAAAWKVNSKAVEWGLIILGVVLGFAFNNLGWIGVLPIVSNLEYALCIFHFKNNERAVKKSFLICVALFFVFNFLIKNYVGAALNTIVFGTTAAYLIKGSKEESVA